MVVKNNLQFISNWWYARKMLSAGQQNPIIIDRKIHFFLLIHTEYSEVISKITHIVTGRSLINSTTQIFEGQSLVLRQPLARLQFSSKCVPCQFNSKLHIHRIACTRWNQSKKILNKNGIPLFYIHQSWQSHYPSSYIVCKKTLR